LFFKDIDFFFVKRKKRQKIQEKEELQKDIDFRAEQVK